MLELNNHIKTRSCMHENIWSLYETDPAAFRTAADNYFAQTYPKYRIYNFDYPSRIVWLVERS